MRKKIIPILVSLLLLGVLAIQAVPAKAEAGILDRVVITPSSANVSVGGTQQFTAQAYDSTNATIAGLNYSWAVIGGGGTINGTGAFTAGSVPGPYNNTVEVIVVQGSVIKFALASVTVTAVVGPLDHIVVTPANATVAVNNTRQFNAQAYDAGNATITGLAFSWSVINSGGTVDGTGKFTAGNVTGTYNGTVQAVATQGSIIKSAFASVTVTAAPPTPTPSPMKNIRTLVDLITRALKQIGFDNFLGATVNIKLDGTTYAVQLTPGTVSAVSDTSLSITPNGSNGTATFTLTSDTLIQPNKTTLKVGDRVVVANVNGLTKLVVKVSGPLPGQLPPGLRKGDKGDRFEDGKTMPPGWTKGKKTGWNNEKSDDEDETEEDDD